jgi:hypothetical protein
MEPPHDDSTGQADAVAVPLDGAARGQDRRDRALDGAAAKNAELKAKKKTRLAVLAEELGLLEEHRGWRQC